MKRSQKEIIETFPLLYTHCKKFECLDGWMDILYRLSSKLEVLIQKSTPDQYFGRPYATQVKEKYGGLRFYMNHNTDEMEELIEKAEKEAKETCEMCASRGKFCVKNKWYQTLCETCAAENGYTVSEK
jgi:hypothetical protein